MYESLLNHSIDFHLYIFAFDDLTNEILLNLKLKKVTVVSLEEFETTELQNVKKERSIAEYCWTCTSSVINYVFENFNAQSCTYIDADLYFYNSPEILLNEMPSNKSVLITEHRFSKLARLFEKKRAGRFCVQFITFQNTVESRAILNKWISQCIVWCYARYEDGKFGDQKYLENWPNDYANVYILQHLGGGLAPWNIRQYDFNFRESQIQGLDKKNKIEFKVIFFHFHFVRLMANASYDLGWNRIPKDVIDGFYKPYIQKIIDKEQFLENTFCKYKKAFNSNKPHGMRKILKYIIKYLSGYNVIKIQ
jgi:hypothetical protein